MNSDVNTPVRSSESYLMHEGGLHLVENLGEFSEFGFETHGAGVKNNRQIRMDL